MRRHLVVALLIGLITITGCRKWQIQSELKQLQTQRASSKLKLDEIDRTVSSLQSQKDQLAARIRSRNNEVAAYLKEHVLAVTCMAAVGYSLGEDNAFSDDVNKMINVGTVFCFAASLLSDDFRNEVAAVVSTLEETSGEIKQLKAKVVPIQSQLDAALRARESGRREFNSLSEEIQKLETEMAKD